VNNQYIFFSSVFNCVIHPLLVRRKTLPKLPLITFAPLSTHSEYLKRYLYRTHHPAQREPLKFVHCCNAITS
jgi:hypothetical protein